MRPKPCSRLPRNFRVRTAPAENGRFELVLCIHSADVTRIALRSAPEIVGTWSAALVAFVLVPSG